MVLQGYKNFVRESVPLYFKQLAELGLGFLHAFVNLNERLNATLFDQLTGAAPSAADPGAPPATRDDGEVAAAGAVPPARLDLRLAGRVGDTVTANVLIENKRPDEVEVSFLISEFFGPTGTEPFRPPLLLDPPQFRLRPGEAQAVALRLPLLSELFSAGERYQSLVLVRGPDERQLHIEVEIEAAPAQPATAEIADPAPPRRPERKPPAGAAALPRRGR